MPIANLRREYNLTGLRRKDLDADPIVQFKRWFEQARGTRTSGRIWLHAWTVRYTALMKRLSIRFMASANGC